MTIYIDSDYKCHTGAAEGRRAVETTAFDGKSPAYIDGYRLVPAGESWTREDGTVFAGEMVAPWLDSRALMLAQEQYEQSEAEHMAETAELVDMIYTNDVGVIG